MRQEAETGRRLARDMRRIREAHNLTVDDLNHETKIPVSLIQAFEDTGLFDHPQFNRVYLRSFMRTYAQVVGIEADTALEALEEALAGRYAGSLAVEYLDEQPEAPHVSSESAADEGDEATTKPAEPIDDEERVPSGDEARDHRRRSDDETTREEREPPIVSTTSEGAGSSQAEHDEGEADEDWSSQSPPSGSKAAASASAAASARPGRSRRRSSYKGADRRGVDRRWIIGGAMVVVVGVIVWILVSMLGDAEPTATEPTAAADTAQVEDTTQAQEPPTPAIDLPAIGDSIDVHIIASEGAVDPIRVTVDDDLRRPYWIDQGDSMAFHSASRIVIEELLDNISLSVEGIEYPTDRRDPQNHIVITRDSVENYFASLEQAQ